MKYLLLSLILLLLAILLGLAVSHDPGYVLIAYRHWGLETSLWVALASLIIIFTIMYFIFRTLGGATRISKNIRRWKKRRRYHTVNYLTNRGLCELATGNWQRAERTLIKATQITTSPFINYLAAACAAQAQRAYERRDNYLHQAHLTTKYPEIALGLTQAQLQINGKQWEQALATLKHLHHSNPGHNYILQLLTQVYRQLQDWQQLQKLLPELRKRDILDATELTTLEKTIYHVLLQQAYRKGTTTLFQAWKALPRTWQQDNTLIRIYSTYLILQNEDATAISLIEHGLKRQWDPNLLENYGRAHAQSYNKQLVTAETWLKTHPRESKLLACLGHLCIREQLWGKARDYLSASIELAPTASSYAALGNVLATLGNQQTAIEYYKKGLAQLDARDQPAS